MYGNIRFLFSFVVQTMESTTINNGTKEVKELFNEIRGSLSREETKGIRKELYKKEVVYNFLKEKEQEGSLTNKQKNVLKNIGRYLKKLNNDLKKLQEYQDNTTYGLDYLFNEVNEEDFYKPTEVKRLSMVTMSYMKVEEIKMLI